MSQDVYERYLSIICQTERLSPVTFARWQLPSVERMARHAMAEVPAYAEALAPVFEGGRFRPENWGAIPPVRRSDIQAAPELYTARNTPPEAGRARSGETSGSTGMPLRFLWSEMASTATRMQMERYFVWHGIDPAGRFADIRLVSDRDDYIETPFKGWSIRSADGEHLRFPVHRPMEDQIRWLGTFRPNYLRTYPSHAVALAAAIRDAQLDLPLDAVFTVGEVLTEDARRDIGEALARDGKPMRVLDIYACQEAGKLALVCPAGHYHVCAESVLLEIVDDEGEPVGPGGEGWIAITTLFNFAMPLIRYLIGDRAIAGSPEPCACGRTLPRIERILGRARNRFILPDGRAYWPSGELALAMRRFVPFRQFQMVQTERGLIELRYVPAENEGSVDEAGLAALVHRRVHPEVTVGLKPVSEIPRSAGGKYEDFICLAR